MTTVYKLTSADMITYGGFRWTGGMTYTTRGKGDLCGHGWLHWYDVPLVGLFANAVHADLPPDTLRLWVGNGGGERLNDYGLKCGYTSMRLDRGLRVPVITIVHRVRLAIATAWGQCTDPT